MRHAAIARVPDRKAQVLFLVGLIFAMAGLNLLTTQVPMIFFTADPSISAHLDALPLQVWAWLFTLTGALAIASGLFRQSVALGYALLMALSTAWGLLYLVSWAGTGYWRSIFGVALYLMISGTLFITSRWPELPKLEPMP